jgi:ketosteroid isomerase-like protein
MQPTPQCGSADAGVRRHRERDSPFDVIAHPPQEGDENMRRTFLAFLTLSGLTMPWSTNAQEGGRSVEGVLEELIALEKSALDRWIVANPDGYLELAAPDITYFDPNQERRVDGLGALKALLGPIKGMQLPFTDPRYEMIAPKIQLYGDVALLTFNLINYAKMGGQAESVLARWNSSEVYRRVDGRWRLVHSHWSYLTPMVQPAQ